MNRSRESKARGEVWVKPGLGKPWRKEGAE